MMYTTNNIIKSAKEILDNGSNEPKNSYPNLYLIDNGWVSWENKEGIKKRHDEGHKSYHGDCTLDIIHELVQIPFDKIHLVNIYTDSPITGEPKVDKRKSLEKVLDLANAGDVMLMNMELYRKPNNIPVINDPKSYEIVNKLCDKGVICIFPAGNSGIDLKDKIAHPKCIIVGSIIEGTNQISSNYCYDEVDPEKPDVPIKKIFYAEVAKLSNHGLFNSSAAAAIITALCLRIRQYDDIDWNKSSATDNFKTKLIESNNDIASKLSFNSNKFTLVDDIDSNSLKSINQLLLWYYTFAVDFSKMTVDNITKITNLMNPINRTIYPFPNKLKFNPKQAEEIELVVSKQNLCNMINHYKQEYLCLKICFGLNEENDLNFICRGYFKNIEDNILAELQVANEINAKDKIGELKKQYLQNSDDFYFNLKYRDASEKSFIAEYFRHFKNYFQVETLGLVIGIPKIIAILTKFYDCIINESGDLVPNNNDSLKLLIVTDTKKLSNGEGKMTINGEPDEAEFGFVIMDGDRTNPICLIKDRVLNEADGPCPPLTPCDE